MSFPLSMQAPVMAHAAGVDEARGPSRPARGRGESGEQPSSFGLACRDVIDEARLRMARRGYRWD
jgi:hypothetical protein